jgi:4a-hydroxytetrahydrobiopterin dehydratase
MTGQELSPQQVAEADLTGWLHVLRALETRIRTPDFITGLALVNRIGAVAEELDHHPDLTLRYAGVDVRLTSHDVGGVTDRDIRLARRITGLAEDAGLVTSLPEGEEG